jgi:hypothetical protein
MVTDIPIGTFVSFRCKGRNELWQVQQHPFMGHLTCIGTVSRPLVPGDVVHRVVWKSATKNATLLSRGTHTLREGDVEWHEWDADTLTWAQTRGENRFTSKAPAWLRNK